MAPHYHRAMVPPAPHRRPDRVMRGTTSDKFGQSLLVTQVGVETTEA